MPALTVQYDEDVPDPGHRTAPLSGRRTTPATTHRNGDAKRWRWGNAATVQQTGRKLQSDLTRGRFRLTIEQLLEGEDHVYESSLPPNAQAPRPDDGQIFIKISRSIWGERSPSCV